MRRISRSGLDDEFCGAWCGLPHGARTPFEIKRKHIQAKANAVELLNRQ
jgi:ethanolamine ammonia-lyase large subunit